MNAQGLSDASFDELFKTHSLIEETDIYDLYYTLGFYSPQIPLTNLYIHGGNNIGFTSFFALDTSKKWGFVLFTNSEYGEILGEELLLYLMTGPNEKKLYLIIGTILLVVAGGVLFLAYLLFKKLRSNKVLS